jgi:7,8-dihydropterin-6-yl-methyl-4-(beta-D-ribofuranosyl)aminobenzene 5'-phosphate synthase
LPGWARRAKIMAVEITVLVDNEPSGKNPFLRTERGHSLHVRWKGRSLLLDTGISGLFADNARMLGIRVAEIDTIVLSHGHFDHSGGLGRFLRENQRATVYAARGVRERLWLSLLGFKKDVGLDPRVLVDARERLHLVDADSEPEVGLHLLACLPFTHPRPRGNRLLFRGAAGKRLPDDFAHELVMTLDDGDGLVVFTGCGHHGVLNMVDGVRHAFPERPIKALVGGFHFVGLPFLGLLAEPRDRVRQIGRSLNALPIGRIVTGHCTGRKGYAALREVLGSRVVYAATGETISV